MEFTKIKPLARILSNSHKNLCLLCDLLQFNMRSCIWWFCRTIKLLDKIAVLRCLHWLKITERIEYKRISLTYKVLTTTHPVYLHYLISVQPPRSTRSSSLITLTRPPTSSSLRITDRCLGVPHLVSGINFLVLSVYLIPLPLSLSCLFMLLSHLLTLSTHHSRHP